MSQTVQLHDQDYKSLYRTLQRRGEKFSDPTFPASASSIRAGSSDTDVEWLRPTELTRRPRLVVGGVRGSDVMQGERGNAWFVTASAAVTTRLHLFSALMPDYPSQDYGSAFHPGVFLFRFQRMGRIYDVVIDDQLPTKRGRLVYCQSGDDGEYWSALLEKAYAKLHGDYHCLRNGRIVDAVACFVRGIPEHWDLAQVRAEVDVGSAAVRERTWKLFRMYLSKHSILLFSLQPDGGKSRLGDWTPQNLVQGRGYILSDTQKLKCKDGSTVLLLQMQNSWSDLEWNGAWSDGSPEWQQLTLETREKLNYQFKQDGLFWMTVDDALRYFTHIDICIVTSTEVGAAAWVSRTIHDEWHATVRRQSSESNAGGSYEYGASYVTNPQYLLRIRSPGRQSVSLCVEQGEASSACWPEKLVGIGLDVFRVEDNRECRLKEPPDASWFKARIVPQKSPSVFLGSAFTPGAYVLVPCADLPGCEQKFTLRVASQQQFELRELGDALPSQGACCVFCYWNRIAVTQFSVTKLTGVGKHLKRRNAQIMVRVTCEGSDVDGWESNYYDCEPGDPDTHSMDFKLLLYRHKLKEPIEIEVFYSTNSSFAKRFVGNTRLTDSDCQSATEKQVALFDDEEETCIKLHCTLHLSGDLTYF